MSILSDNDLCRLEKLKKDMDIASEIFDYNLDSHDCTILLTYINEIDNYNNRLVKFIKNFDKYLNSLWIDDNGITTRIKDKYKQFMEEFYNYDN